MRSQTSEKKFKYVAAGLGGLAIIAEAVVQFLVKDVAPDGTVTRGTLGVDIQNTIYGIFALAGLYGAQRTGLKMTDIFKRKSGGGEEAPRGIAPPGDPRNM